MEVKGVRLENDGVAFFPDALANAVQAERLKILGNRAMNIGVDVNNYFPVSIEAIIKQCT